MRIDIALSVIPKGINDLEVYMEEQNIKNEIGRLLREKGYDRFIVVGSDILNEETKSKVVLD